MIPITHLNKYTWDDAINFVLIIKRRTPFDLLTYSYKFVFNQKDIICNIERISLIILS